jgi:sugar/nucleoside kinase (ribokinase family)
LLALDLQGFVRRPQDPSGGFDRDVELSGLLGRTDVIKAAEPELEALTAGSRDAMRSAIVLVTHGDRGASVFHDGSKVTVTAEPVSAPNTIGAGDTFLSAFIAALLQGCSLQEAGDRAARFTEQVLRERINGK